MGGKVRDVGKVEREEYIYIIEIFGFETSYNCAAFKCSSIMAVIHF